MANNDDASHTTPQLLRCPYCEEEIQPDATKCRYCREYLPNIQEGMAERLRLHGKVHLLEESKAELIRWLKWRYWGAAALATIAIFGLGSFGVDLAMKNAIENKLEEKVGMRIQNILGKIDFIVHDVGSLATEAGEQGIAGLQKTIRDQQRNIQQRVLGMPRVYELDGRFNPRQQESPLVLESPISFFSGVPRTIFSHAMTLRWHHYGSELGKNTYYIQIASSRSFDEVTQICTPNPYLYVNLADKFSTVDHDCSRNVPITVDSGQIHWRVKVGTSGDWSQPEVFEIYKNGFARMQGTGKVRIGISDLAIPDLFSIDSHGNPSGLEMELSQRLIKLLKVDLDTKVQLTPQFIRYDWDNLLSAPQRGEVEFIISAITKNDVRADEYGLKFTAPYYTTAQVLYLASTGFDKNEKKKLKNALGDSNADKRKTAMQDTLRESQIIVQAFSVSFERAQEISQSGKNIIKVSSVADGLAMRKKTPKSVFVTDCLAIYDEIEEDNKNGKMNVQDFLFHETDEYSIGISKKQTALFTAINGYVKASKDYVNKQIEESDMLKACLKRG